MLKEVENHNASALTKLEIHNAVRLALSARDRRASHGRPRRNRINHQKSYDCSEMRYFPARCALSSRVSRMLDED
jgi:hypothetical protein